MSPTPPRTVWQYAELAWLSSCFAVVAPNHSSHLNPGSPCTAGSLVEKCWRLRLDTSHGDGPCPHEAMVELLLGQKWRDRVQPRGPTGMGDGVSQGEPLAQPHCPRHWHGCRCPGMLPKHRSPRGRSLDLLPAACGRMLPSVRHGTARGAWPRGAEVRCLCCCCQIHTCGSGKKSHPIIRALGQVRAGMAEEDSSPGKDEMKKEMTKLFFMRTLEASVHIYSWMNE
ncbi:uncharacterized protein LOC115348598 isoform X2 [Aquila chrysaetos chrysaetos]|uniref:uncharacterized protein LOC115348598 isoform X2 n=1 Tax=Aquila chrysaetos chrysaetos TaxID=223781 RepID=UPI001176F8CD|nr:uncharacterized protein LOC115348598 isoform X2 [Aquila chrysaetos chrysaetos]